MTKKELEKRYKFALFQLKRINELANKEYTTDDDMAKRLGRIQYYSDPEAIKKCIEHIENYNQEYNCYDETINIDDYIN